MQDFIFDIYKYAQLIPAMKEIVDKCYEHSHDTVPEEFGAISDLLVAFCEDISKSNYSLASDIMNIAEEACAFTRGSAPDFIRMGDRLSDILPLLQEGMENLGGIDVEDGNYRLISSKSGFLCLENLTNERRYNSLIDPMHEALIKAKSLYSTKHTQFILAGCDLGYLAYQLYLVSDMSLDIYIYHVDKSIVDYAIEYGVLSWIPEDKLHIITGSKEKVLIDLKRVDYKSINTGFMMLPDFSDIVSSDETEKVMEASIPVAARYVNGYYNEINLWRNLKNVPKTIYDIKKDSNKTEWMVIVAGPSLDDNIDYIKENSGRFITIAASTVYKKLINSGIVPDYVIVCDPLPRTYGHFEGNESFKSRLLVAGTANWRFAEKYQGEKYLVPCDSSFESMSYFNMNKIKMVGIRGTVAYGAVVAAMTLGARTIHLIGLDLAYPGLVSHASNTMDQKKMNEDDLITIKSVAGEDVKTSNQFMYYIKQMEELFLSHKEVKFINHSRIGAAFKGTQNCL